MSMEELAYQGITDMHSRRKFLKRMGLMGGGAVAMGIVGQGITFGVAYAQTANNDIATVQFAYTLELVAIEAYTAGVKSGLLSAGVTEVGKKFAGHHTDHAAALKAALEANKAMVPAAPTKINFPAFKTEKDIVEFALALESAAVGAYYGAAGGFTNRDLAVAAASIVGVESTHVALLSSALGQDPIPTAFVIGTPFADVQKTAAALLAPAGGQGGGTTPATLPATGIGGSAKADTDFTGAAVGVMGIMAAAAAAVIAVKNRKPVTSAKAEANNDQE